MSELTIQPARSFGDLHVGDHCVFTVTGRVYEVTEDRVEVAALGSYPTTVPGDRTVRVAVKSISLVPDQEDDQ
jgi:hypothetical protein